VASLVDKVFGTLAPFNPPSPLSDAEGHWGKPFVILPTPTWVTGFLVFFFLFIGRFISSSSPVALSLFTNSADFLYPGTDSPSPPSPFLGNPVCSPGEPGLALRFKRSLLSPVPALALRDKKLYCRIPPPSHDVPPPLHSLFPPRGVRTFSPCGPCRSEI